MAANSESEVGASHGNATRAAPAADMSFPAEGSSAHQVRSMASPFQAESHRSFSNDVAACVLPVS